MQLTEGRAFGSSQLDAGEKILHLFGFAYNADKRPADLTDNVLTSSLKSAPYIVTTSWWLSVSIPWIRGLCTPIMV